MTIGKKFSATLATQKLNFQKKISSKKFVKFPISSTRYYAAPKSKTINERVTKEPIFYNRRLKNKNIEKFYEKDDPEFFLNISRSHRSHYIKK